MEGTDNVYIFRAGGHQAMFIATKDGVIATDPISFQRQTAKNYMDEIRKVTDKPVRYVIYSHSHFDHIAGGKIFKDAGAKFIAHKNAKDALLRAKYPDVVMPDETIGNRRDIKLGGTTLELHFTGRNHSDNSLVMRLPKEKIIFAVDFIPLDSVMFRNMPDSYIPEWEDSIKKVIAMDWNVLIPGHPGKGGRQTGTKKDAQDVLAFMQDLSAEVKKAADAGKCFDTAMKEIKLPKYEAWGNDATYFAGNVERYCGYWGRGF